MINVIKSAQIKKTLSWLPLGRLTGSMSRRHTDYFGQNALAQKMTTLNNLFWYLMKSMDRLLGDDTLDVTGSEIDSLLGNFFRNCHYLVSTAD